MYARNNPPLRNMKTYCFDIDGTLCHLVPNGDYSVAIPMAKAVDEVNRLYDEGNTIILFTARGASSGMDWHDMTVDQLRSWGLKYHRLITKGKPSFDVLIDDKAINASDWRNSVCGTRGVLAGAFDLIHPGYCKMMDFCKNHCDHLTVLLHDDPSLERNKMRPVHTVEERREVLMSMKFVDDVIIYQSEQELEMCLSSGKYDVRFLGEDYRGKDYTGKHIALSVVFVPRQHTYSTTALKKAISESYTQYMKG
jgi:cytidyltransferase-like protein